MQGSSLDNPSSRVVRAAQQCKRQATSDKRQTDRQTLDGLDFQDRWLGLWLVSKESSKRSKKRLVDGYVGRCRGEGLVADSTNEGNKGRREKEGAELGWQVGCGCGCGCVDSRL